MPCRPRRNHTVAFKAEVVLAALKGDKTLAELALCSDLHANQNTEWKTRLQERAAGVFGEGKAELESVKVDVTRMQAKIGGLTLENDFGVCTHQSRIPTNGSLFVGWKAGC